MANKASPIKLKSLKLTFMVLSFERFNDLIFDRFKGANYWCGRLPPIWGFRKNPLKWGVKKKAVLNLSTAFPQKVQRDIKKGDC